MQTFAILAFLLGLLGSGAALVGFIILIRSLFITDEEIDDLAGLPIRQSSTNLTPTGSSESVPVALIPPHDLMLYRDRFIVSCRRERHNGRIGLRLLIGGFLCQALANLFALLSAV